MAIIGIQSPEYTQQYQPTPYRADNIGAQQIASNTLGQDNVGVYNPPPPLGFSNQSQPLQATGGLTPSGNVLSKYPSLRGLLEFENGVLTSNRTNLAAVVQALSTGGVIRDLENLMGEIKTFSGVVEDAAATSSGIINQGNSRFVTPGTNDFASASSLTSSQPRVPGLDAVQNVISLIAAYNANPLGTLNSLKIPNPNDVIKRINDNNPNLPEGVRKLTDIATSLQQSETPKTQAKQRANSDINSIFTAGGNGGGGNGGTP